VDRRDRERKKKTGPGWMTVAGKEQEKKKGPLALASGPSLGRKRPRRAAIARGATAPQQYATALHKTQELLKHFRCKIHRGRLSAKSSIRRYFLSYFKYLNIDLESGWL
jgi:hypothetical protein